METVTTVKNPPNWKRHNSQKFLETFAGEKIEILTLEQVREILGKALQGKSLSDYLREDRDMGW